MNPDPFGYVEMSVQFGQDGVPLDTARKAFPYLGTTTLLGGIEALLAGSGAQSPRRFIPVCTSVSKALAEGRFADAFKEPSPVEEPEMLFDIAEGQRMCRSICKALRTVKADQTGLQGIASDLITEMNDLLILFAFADEQGLKFNFNLQTCEKPPAPLTAWMTGEMEDTRKVMAKLVQEVEQHCGKLAFAGGDGSSIEKAVLITNAKTEEEGVAAESEWVRQVHAGWKKRRQSLVGDAGKMYDEVEYVTPEGETKTIYFDISAFVGGNGRTK